MHPKGTCSASLHCVGIAPYGTTAGNLCVGAGFCPDRFLQSLRLRGALTPPFTQGRLDAAALPWHISPSVALRATQPFAVY